MNQRVQGMPGAPARPQLVCRKITRVVATGSPVTFRHSLRDGFTVSFVLFPEIGLVVSVVGAMREHCRLLDASVEASEPHDFAVRFARRSSFASQSVHRSPRPTFVTIGQTPLLIGHGMGQILLLICPTAQRRRVRHTNTTGKSVAARQIVSSDERLLG
jgi:hypothetical protein